MYCTSKGHFLTDIIGYDMLKLYLKIYTHKNEILGTPLLTDSYILKRPVAMHNLYVRHAVSLRLAVNIFRYYLRHFLQGFCHGMSVMQCK